MRNKITTMITANKNPKHKQLLATAIQLFLKHGFKRVSIEELCKEAQVSKVTFYRHYKSKDELIGYIIGSWVDSIIRDINEIMDSEQSIKLKFDQIAITKLKFTHNLGDEMLRSIMLFPQAKQQMEDFGKLIWQKLSKLLEEEQELGNINPKLDVAKTVRFLMALNNLYRSEELLSIYDNMEEMIVQINEILVMGLVARETK